MIKIGSMVEYHNDRGEVVAIVPDGNRPMAYVEFRKGRSGWVRLESLKVIDKEQPKREDGDFE